MIDLRNRALPDTITIQGRAFSIYTDFRVWLDFGEKIKNPNTKLRELTFVFNGPVPNCNFLKELIDFYRNDNATPNKDMATDSDDTLVDYILDGEYIYASFMYDYGIDLIDNVYNGGISGEMGYNRGDEGYFNNNCYFNINYPSLSSNNGYSKIKTIMGFRGYKKPSKNYDINKEREKLKRIWSLDELLTQEEIDALEEFNNL